MASPVAAQIRAFGEDVVPGQYADFEEADLLLFAGSNAAWCHPVLFQRALAARERRGSWIVVIDPRRSATAELADLHIPIRPGGDGALFAALLAECARCGALDVHVETGRTENSALATRKLLNFMAAEIKYATCPSPDARLPRVLMLVKGGAVEPRQRRVIARKMRRHPVNNDADAPACRALTGIGNLPACRSG